MARAPPPPARMTWCCSITAGNEPSQVRSKPRPWSSASQISRSFCSGSMHLDAERPDAGGEAVVAERVGAADVHCRSPRRTVPYASMTPRFG